MVVSYLFETITRRLNAYNETEDIVNYLYRGCKDFMYYDVNCLLKEKTSIHVSKVKISLLMCTIQYLSQMKAQLERYQFIQETTDFKATSHCASEYLMKTEIIGHSIRLFK